MLGDSTVNVPMVLQKTKMILWPNVDPLSQWETRPGWDRYVWVTENASVVNVFVSKDLKEIILENFVGQLVQLVSVMPMAAFARIMVLAIVATAFAILVGKALTAAAKLTTSVVLVIQREIQT